MKRLRIRFTIRSLMFAIAATALSLAALLAYREHLRKVEKYRLLLGLAPSVAGRSHFSSGERFREFLETCRRAEEYIGIAMRPGTRAAPKWTDEDERSWQRGKRIISDEAARVWKDRGSRIIPDSDDGAYDPDRLPSRSDRLAARDRSSKAAAGPGGRSRKGKP